MPISIEIAEFIQKGANDKLESALKENPALADGKTEQGISFLQFATYCRNKAAIDLFHQPLAEHGQHAKSSDRQCVRFPSPLGQWDPSPSAWSIWPG